MPDLSICLKDRNGNIWCWDKEVNAVLRIKTEQTAIEQIPPEVLFGLLGEMSKHPVEKDRPA